MNAERGILSEAPTCFTSSATERTAAGANRTEKIVFPAGRKDGTNDPETAGKICSECEPNEKTFSCHFSTNEFVFDHFRR